MTRHDQDDPLQRLRAADPAAGAPAPDHERVRAAVTARLAAEAQGTDGDAARTAADRTAGPAGAAAAQPDQQAGAAALAGAPAADERPPATDRLAARRRRRQPLRYAAAAAGAVLLLSGGYAWGAGAQGGGDAGSADAAGQEAAADAGAPETAPQTAGQSAPEGTGLTGADQSAGDASDARDAERPRPAPRPVVFTAASLPAGPATAAAWGLDPGVGPDRAARLAAALGLSGDPQEQDGSWLVGTGDGPVLHLYADGSITYTDPALRRLVCLPVEPMNEPQAAPAPEAGTATAPGSAPDPGSSSGSGAAEPGSSGTIDCSATDTPPPPDAQTTFTRFLADAGLDVDRYDVGVVATGGSATVTGTLLAGGQPTGVTISATIVTDGIAAVWGSVATPYELGEYALISPTEAVQRLSDPRFGPTGPALVAGAGSPVTLPGTAGGDQTTASPVLPATPAEPLTPGSAVPWPLRQVQITTAELTLVRAATSAGVLLLPGYALTGTDSAGTEGTWTVPALTEDAFDFTG